MCVLFVKFLCSLNRFEDLTHSCSHLWEAPPRGWSWIGQSRCPCCCHGHQWYYLSSLMGQVLCWYSRFVSMTISPTLCVLLASWVCTCVVRCCTCCLMSVSPSSSPLDPPIQLFNKTCLYAAIVKILWSGFSNVFCAFLLGLREHALLRNLDLSNFQCWFSGLFSRGKEVFFAFCSILSSLHMVIIFYGSGRNWYWIIGPNHLDISYFK